MPSPPRCGWTCTVLSRNWTTAATSLPVVLCGAGGSFSAGSDLDRVRSSDPECFGELHELAENTVLRLRDLHSATFAEIDGPCFGAGCSLALACDVRICSPRSRFGIPVLRHGIVYEPVHVQRLVEVVGPGPAGLLLYGGEEWTAQEAVTRRLVDRCNEDPASVLEQGSRRPHLGHDVGYQSDHDLASRASEVNEGRHSTTGLAPTVLQCVAILREPFDVVFALVGAEVDPDPSREGGEVQVA
jgi:enoyl-CoA hydratase/carnithine racemase